MLRDARVATVVLNYRHTEDTVACVRALQRSSFLDMRLVVVDNAPEGPEHDALREAVTRVTAPAGGVDVVATGGNLGYAGGNNVGLRLALRRRPEFLLVINPDLLVSPTTIEQLVGTARQIPDAAAIGPRIVHAGTDPVRIWFDGGIFDRENAGATSHLHNGRFERDHPPTGPRDTDYVTGACLLLRADAVRQVGLITEDYFLYFEETDYNQRLAAAGWRLVVDPRARAVHDKRSSGDLPTPAYTYYMRRNKQLFARRMGLDERAAVEQFRQVWIDPWLRNVGNRAPAWLPTFEALLAKAEADAEAGVSGPVDLSAYPAHTSPAHVAAVEETV